MTVAVNDDQGQGPLGLIWMVKITVVLMMLYLLYS